MKVIHGIAACVALCLPIAASAGQSNPASPGQTAKPKSSSANPDKLICRGEEDTGSRITKKKVCRTAAQWREESFRAGEWTERMSTSLGKPGGG